MLVGCRESRYRLPMINGRCAKYRSSTDALASGQIDPLLPFKVALMNGGKREKADFG
jgi:hypothetical protein